MKCNYDKGDVVETPLGVGEIVSILDPVSHTCLVRLEKPLVGGDSDGQRDVTVSSFQFGRIIREGISEGLKKCP